MQQIPGKKKKKKNKNKTRQWLKILPTWGALPSSNIIHFTLQRAKPSSLSSQTSLSTSATVTLFLKKYQRDFLLRVATMGVMAAGHSSTLNPHAPIFVPWSYRTVEDYSAEWWELVRSSPCFRDYWLRECFLDDAAPLDLDDVLESVVLADAEAAFDGPQSIIITS